MSADLATFLLERVAADEAKARDGVRCWGDALPEGVPEDELIADSGIYVSKEYTEIGLGYGRFLAECEAKRRIVELHPCDGHECYEMHRGIWGAGWPDGSYAVEGQAWAHPSLEGSEVHPGPCETLRLLALPYAAHPDYQPEWAPEPV